MEEMKELQLYQSRKNHVYLSEIEGYTVVVKEMSDPHAYWREKTIYEGLWDKSIFTCPEILEAQDDCHRFIMEYIPGETVLHVLEEAEKVNNLDLAMNVSRKLICWLQDFHQSQKSLNGEMTLGDINFRNFLWSQGQIYGIDFEDCVLGSGREELIHVPAFYLLYDPEETPFKRKVVQAMISEIQNYKTMTEAQLQRAIGRRKKAIKERRNKKTSPVRL